MLAGVRIDGTSKGFPALTEPVAIADVPNLGWTAARSRSGASHVAAT